MWSQSVRTSKDLPSLARTAVFLKEPITRLDQVARLGTSSNQEPVIGWVFIITGGCVTERGQTHCRDVEGCAEPHKGKRRLIMMLHPTCLQIDSSLTSPLFSKLQTKP